MAKKYLLPYHSSITRKKKKANVLEFLLKQMQTANHQIRLTIEKNRMITVEEVMVAQRLVIQELLQKKGK